MSQMMCMGQSPAFSRVGLPKGRYDAWSRAASDRFRKEVVSILAQGSELESVVKASLMAGPYDFFATLPPERWTTGDYRESLNLSMIRALFSKDEDMESPIDRQAVALREFHRSEVQNGRTNHRLLNLHLSSEAADVVPILVIAQRKISEVLGVCPVIDDLVPSFGPGAAVTCKKYTTARFKLSTPPSISNSGRPIIDKMAAGMLAWYQLHSKVQVVPGQLEFVPKNYKTYRSIAIEPSLSGCYQRAVGKAIKHRLKRAGVDLYDQDINRGRARLGSFPGSDICTIDLKSASNTISYQLVAELLPSDWFGLLDCLRSESVTLPDGRIHRLMMFSSMGNGYTFELESLLFYSLGYGIARHFNVPFDLTVYGDDLICSRPLAELITKWFPFFGFSTNVEKTFMSGPFRESCGGDYVHGVDVRPFFVKGRMTFHTVVCFYNHLCRKPHQDPDHKIRDLLISYLPHPYRLYGPDGYGDGHLISDRPLEEYLTPYGRDKGWEGYTFNTYIENPTRVTDSVLGDIALPAYNASVASGGTFHRSVSQKLAFSVNVRSTLRSFYRASFLKETISRISDPLDHYVVRKSRNARSTGRRVRVYVLG